jgi:hypothetical protein
LMARDRIGQTEAFNRLRTRLAAVGARSGRWRGTLLCTGRLPSERG